MKLKEKIFIVRGTVGPNASVTHITEEINGILESIFIDASKPVSIVITYEDFPNIVLYQETNVVGQHYISPGIEFRYPTDDVANEAVSKFSIKGKLIVKVFDNINMEVKFKILYLE